LAQVVHHLSIRRIMKFLAPALSIALLDGYGSFLSGRDDRNPFTTLETCNKKYEELYRMCERDGWLPHQETIIREPIIPHQETIIREPIIKKSIADTKDIKGVPLYQPPKIDGSPSENGFDYLKNGEDWVGMCASGAGQSPIDIARDVDIQGQTKYVLWFDYFVDPDLETKKGVDPYLENNGHGVQFTVPFHLHLGHVKLFKTEYIPREYDFHAPSEHTLDGATFPLELQLLNVDSEGKILAIAFFFREGESNEFLSGLMKSVGQGPRWKNAVSRKTMDKRIANAFNLDSLIPKGKQHPGGHLTFYNYEGSLTIPPCTRGVDWWVSAKPLTATKAEIDFVKRAILESESTKHGNSRATQPLDGRKILVGMTNFQHSDLSMTETAQESRT